jgi:hypothetical protein
VKNKHNKILKRAICTNSTQQPSQSDLPWSRFTHYGNARDLVTNFVSWYLIGCEKTCCFRNFLHLHLDIQTWNVIVKWGKGLNPKIRFVRYARIHVFRKKVFVFGNPKNLNINNLSWVVISSRCRANVELWFLCNWSVYSRFTLKWRTAVRLWANGWTSSSISSTTSKTSIDIVQKCST